MKTPRQKLYKKLDTLWSLIVRKDCVCELCGHRSNGSMEQKVKDLE